MSAAFLRAYRTARRRVLAELDGVVAKLDAARDPELARALAFAAAARPIEEAIADRATVRGGELAGPDGDHDEAAAGEAAAALHVAVAVAAQVAYLRCAAPEDPVLRAEADARARAAEVAIEELRARAVAAGLRPVDDVAALVASRDLCASDAAGFERLALLVRQLEARLQAPDAATLVLRWAEDVCRTGDPAELVAAFAPLSALVAERGHSRIEPLPSGVTRARVFVDLATQRSVEHVELELAAPPTLAQLEAQLGSGAPTTRVSATSPHKRAFVVRVDGAPGECDVFATFRTTPGSDSVAGTIVLRRGSAG